jgi:hypothetical protein
MGYANPCYKRISYKSINVTLISTGEGKVYDYAYIASDLQINGMNVVLQIWNVSHSKPDPQINYFEVFHYTSQNIQVNVRTVL